MRALPLVKIDSDIPLVPAALLACAIPTGYGSSVKRKSATAFGAAHTAVWAADAVALVRDLTRKGGTCVLTGMAPAGALPVHLDEMITCRHRLGDINTAFDDLRSGELVRGVIDFEIA
ncbi:hypothetical protein MSAR_06990 [Mycolicibacterium sarraceniae]|uniref:Alcohol dehydrogenase n=1 Tax=Mycolicibacterium sarraceniae TaxID=1534348 RepID=A0A7I7SLE4_9MYCO|nr:hypothetical protein MSAR_06990 [Mycolicibacterium sarraceniae]